jgi:predicted RNA polymerase sigma factor
VRDERLRLVMLCAHPALSRENAAALTLRMVIGVSTADIARLFLVPTATMAARLTRSRKSLAGERFEVPLGPELKARVGRAADVAYLSFTAGYAPPSGAELLRTDLAAEAIRLARLLRELLPGRPDLDGLLGLMLLQHSRRDARLVDGRMVLLPDQDRSRWHSAEISEALDVLTPHVTAPGTPYLVQALIAAEHAIAPHPETTDWPRIVQRYDELVALADSPVVRLNRAVAVSEADGPLAGLRALDGLELPGHRLPGVRGQLLAKVGRTDEARAELTRAVHLCDNDPERTHLADRLAALDG